MMKTLGKIGRGIAGLFIGKANEAYRSGLIVHDMKGRYIKGRDSLQDLRNQKLEVKAQIKVAMEEQAIARKELDGTTRDIKAIDVDNPANSNRFNVLKAKYDSLKSKIDNASRTIEMSKGVLDNLDKMIATTEAECEKLRLKIEEVESNVRTLDNLKRINGMVRSNTESLSDNGFDVEDLERDMRHELAKFSVVSEDINDVKPGENLSVEEMKRFKESI